MENVDFQHRTRIISGPGQLESVGQHAVDLGANRVMVVCDPGIRQAGYAQRAVQSLHQSNMETEVFDDFGENPTASMVDAGTERAAQFRPDLLIGLGGGSSMDCCKGINFVYSCGGTIADYRGVGNATADLLPMIAVPTTAGTGSEMQSFAIISDDVTHLKMPCGDPRAAPRIAILDPTLTLSQPHRVAMLTAIDAISHAVETHVTRRRNRVSQTYSGHAFELLASGFERLLKNPEDLEVRSDMQWGAAFAGMAIEASMLGAAHATANPLTAHHGVPHGQAVGLMLPAVVRMNGKQHPRRYTELAARLPKPPTSDPVESLARTIEGWVREAGLVNHIEDLRDHPIDPTAQMDAWVQDAMQQWTGTFNPVTLTPDNVRQLYRSVCRTVA